MVLFILPPSSCLLPAKEETLMRGRHPWGLEFIDHLQGSAKAKARLRAILETMLGDERVGEVCAHLAICEQRFRQLRTQGMQAALYGLEDRPSGRPPRPEPSEEVAEL